MVYGGGSIGLMGLLCHAIHAGYNLSGEFFSATSPTSGSLSSALRSWPSSHGYTMRWFMAIVPRLYHALIHGHQAISHV
jgi:hypothetical protein